MKKLLFCLLACFMLCGCANITDVQADLNERLASVNEIPVMATNFSHGYYAFYLQPKVGRLSSEKTTDVFTLNGTKFVMNLNVTSMINSAYYTSALDTAASYDSDTIIAMQEGSYIDNDGDTHDYTVHIYQLTSSYLTVFYSDVVEMYSFGSLLSELNIAEEMLRIARTVHYDKDEIVAAFSNRQTISYTRTKLELFQDIVPEDGAIQELFSTTTYSSGDYYGDTYDENSQEEEVGSGGDELEGYSTDELVLEEEEESNEESAEN